jgi:predicted O-linked N-acetylglucosamine transferase (SPINDLY family)
MTSEELLKQGIELRNARQWPRAVAALREAVAGQPDNTQALYMLALTLDECGFPAEAITLYQRAIAIDPNMVAAYSNMGGLLAGAGRVDEAIAALRRALQLAPNLPEAFNNLGNALEQAGQIEQSAECYRRAAILSPERAYFASNYLYSLYFQPRATPELIRGEHAVWNRLYGEPMRKLAQPHTNDRTSDRRLRIGYVFPINHAHPAFMPPLILNHDRALYHVVCYSDRVHEDGLTKQLQQNVEQWRMTRGLSDLELAAQIRDDKIDILIDLTMHMSGSRLVAFACKPAPIQVAYLAYPGTTGLWAMDYRFTDEWLDPPGPQEDHYTEKSIRLPQTFACYNPAAIGAPLTPSPSTLGEGRGEGQRQLLFASLNNFCKLNDYVLALWSRVLNRVPNSRLKLLAHSDAGRRFVLDALSRNGVDAGRINFVGKLPSADYWNAYRSIDICLDTLPYCGHTTTLDALWMGVPVITRVGSTAAGRASWSVYNNLSLTELAAHDDDQFVRIAVALANDRPRLAELHRTLHDRLLKSPVMDAQAFARNVEAAYRVMWRTWVGV